MARLRHIQGLFVQFAQRDIRSAAFDDLNHSARAALFELCMCYWESGLENPRVITGRWLASKLKLNPKTAALLLTELETHGFLEVERIGKMSGPPKDRGTVFRMTWLPTSDGYPATFDYRRWMPSIPPSNAPRGGAHTRANGADNAPKRAVTRGSKRNVAGNATGAAAAPKTHQVKASSIIIDFAARRTRKT